MTNTSPLRCSPLPRISSKIAIYPHVYDMLWKTLAKKGLDFFGETGYTNFR